MIICRGTKQTVSSDHIEHIRERIREYISDETQVSSEWSQTAQYQGVYAVLKRGRIRKTQVRRAISEKFLCTTIIF